MMRKVSDYKRHAQECRDMAAKAQNPLHRQQLRQMAKVWDMLAQDRAKSLGVDPNTPSMGGK